VAAQAATLPLCLHGVAQQPFELDLSYRTTISAQHVSDMLLLQDGKIHLSGQIRWPASRPTFAPRGQKARSNGHAFRCGHLPGFQLR
jgi:hypothetical protein